jgi:predicted anti-sigma-YlaC factor YlaD
MNCRTARRIIDLEPDRPLSDPESTGLSKHLAKCAHCRDYREAIRAAAGILDSDAGSGAAERPSPAYSPSLRTALRAASREHENRPIARIDRCLQSALPRLPRIPAALTTALAAVALIALLSLAGTRAMHSDTHPATGIPTGHIVSLHTLPTPNGSVTASMTAQTALPHHVYWRATP